MLFDRYILLNFLKLFLSVSIVVIFLASIYGFLDFFLSFKEKSLKVAVEYFISLIPLSFYYSSPLILSVSLTFFLKRLIDKKTDLIVQSFGLSPLRFSLPLILFSLFLSSFFILGNEFLFPKLLNNLKKIEKAYKKKEFKGEIIRNLWFLKETGSSKIYFYIENLDLSNSIFFNLLYIKVSKELEPYEYLKAKSGKWQGKRILVFSGRLFNFIKQKNESLIFKEINIQVSLEDVKLFSESIDFLSLSYLIKLSLKGKEFGFNSDIYLGEAIFRVFFSLTPLFLSVAVIYTYLKLRELKKTILANILLIPAMWIISIFPKVITQKAGESFYISFIPILLTIFAVIYATFSLKRGFKV